MLSKCYSVATAQHGATRYLQRKKVSVPNIQNVYPFLATTVLSFGYYVAQVAHWHCVPRCWCATTHLSPDTLPALAHSDKPARREHDLPAVQLQAMTARSGCWTVTTETCCRTARTATTAAAWRRWRWSMYTRVTSGTD
jgi:hypothetical protein